MGDWQPNSAVGTAVWVAGFSYDPDQDIIFSRMDALQRRFGYAYGYDVAALGMSAVIDCEPIFFDYGGKHWMIELWKGQYGVETGCEIGVYTRPIDDQPGPMYRLLDSTIGNRGDAVPSHNLFYDCAGDGELLEMSLTLYRNGERVFSRGPEKHWWLTGFKWGILSRPEELTVEITIGLLDSGMRDALATALRTLGYTDVQIAGNTISFEFARPFSSQPRDAVAGGAEAVMAANAQIVQAYDALHLPNNDPNQVGAEFLEFVGLGVVRRSDYFGRLVAQAGVEVLRDIGAVVNALTGFFQVHGSEVSDWLGAAVDDFLGWVRSVQGYFGLTLDRSCIVEIDNTKGSSDLIRGRVTADPGEYGVNPPSWIPKGGVGRFVLHDVKLSWGGSDGSVVYNFATPDFRRASATMRYACPLMSANTASVDSGHFRILARSTGDWSTSVPGSGSPLYVKFIAGG